MEGGNGVRISYIQPQTLTSTFIAVCSNYFLIHFSIIHMTQLLLIDMTHPNLSAESPFSILYVLFGVVWPSAWWVWCIGLDIITLRGKCICICIVTMLHCSTGRTRILKDVWRIEHKNWSASDAFKQIDF